MTIIYALFYAALCWAVLSFVPAIQIGPGFFLVLFFISLALGFLLIVLQVNTDTGDNGEAIVTLSGEIIPAVKKSSDRIQQEQNLQSWVWQGKILFFFLSLFILVFWVKLSVHGFPKEWWDKGYSFLIFVYAFGDAGRHLTHAYQDLGYGDYLSVARNVSKIGLDIGYIVRPVLLGIPYSGFIYWVLSGHQLFTAYQDEDQE